MYFSDDNIGENIQEIRKDRNITQLQLADLLGISVSTLSSYETGKTSPPYSLIVKIAECLGTTAEIILDVKSKESDLEQMVTNLRSNEETAEDSEESEEE